MLPLALCVGPPARVQTYTWSGDISIPRWIDALSAEDFNVKSSSIPHAHTKYKQEVCTRPERRGIENKDRGDFCKDSVDLHNVVV